ncbi:MAG: hypothetical protein JHC33_06115 [Ignisphaera sp.]|nr:hypothetical protein [Ignisphaera sp.]
MFLVNFGELRGKIYTNSGDTDYARVPVKALPDGTLVTIKKKHQNFNWVMLNEDLWYNWYPLDLLTPISKSGYILRLLECS